MDGSRWNWIILILILTLQVACGKSKTPHTVLRQVNDECKESATPDRFIVRWTDGRRTVEKAPDRERFIEDFITPNLEKIESAEHDHWIRAEDASPLSHWGAPEINNWGIENVNAAAAWQRGVRGQGVTVAVIDSGLDRNHSLLKDRVAWNSKETGIDHLGRDRSSNGIDDDGNGYIDDYAGYDFYALSGDVRDDSDHGTHVSGIIAASHDDDVHVPDQLQGVAPESKILPLDFITGDGGYVSDAILAIEYAIKMKAKVINASWGGGPCVEELATAINSLSQHNMLFIAASGNSALNIDDYRRYPASHILSTQITVGSITPFGGMADHSNFGERSVNIFAPGFEISSTVPGNSYAVFSGTSMATPFVTGAAALLWSYRPQASFQEIKQAILQGVTVNNTYRNSTRGRLNIEAALNTLN